MDEKYDVIIVGAGPGGSITARECAKRGLKTLVIDRRQEIGAPVRCGEGLGKGWMRKANLEYDSSWCLREQRGAVIYSPSRKKIEVEIEPEYHGYVIERKMFEKKLAVQAAKEGTKYLLKTRVYDVIKENGFVVGVKTEGPDGKKEFRAKIIIAADGVDSQTAKYAGVDTSNKLTEVDSGYEYEMVGVKVDPPDMIHLFVGNEIAPRGYIWVFMKSEDLANVGMGVSGDQEKTTKYYLDKFIETHPEIFKDATPIEIKGGCVPVGAPLKKPYANGLLIVGDAAHMVNPIHGGGMGPAMEAGMLAGKIAKEAIDKGDVSENFLKRYADEWYEIRGNQLLGTLKVRQFFEKLSDSDLDTLADLFTPETLLEFSEGKKLKTFMNLFANNPRLALTAAKTLI